jgi:hypothetical protein
MREQKTVYEYSRILALNHSRIILFELPPKNRSIKILNIDNNTSKPLSVAGLFLSLPT